MLLLVVSLAACAFLLECSMIVFEPYLPGTGQFVYDEDIGFRIRPHSSGSNEFGFKDSDYPRPKPKGTIRVVFLGDSFSWAGGDRNYVDVARDLVKTGYPKSEIDVINTGYPMTHTGEQLEVLRKFGLQYEPDVVVLSFFAGNDFADGNRYRKRLVLNDCFYDIDVREESFLFGYPMVGRSRLWTFIKQKLRIAGSVESVGSYDTPDTDSRVATAFPDEARAGVATEAVQEHLRRLAKSCPPEVAKAGLTEEAYVGLVARKMKICEKSGVDRYAPRVGFILGKLDEMAALLRERGVHFFVGIFPDEYQISPATRDAALARLRREAADYDFERPQKILRAHLQESGIPHLDFLPYLRRAHAIRPVCYPRESHYNYYGNAVVAHAYFTLFLRPALEGKLGKPR